jgi:hypothetical protein
LDELCNFLDEVDTGVGRGASPAHTKAGELVATARRKAPLRSLSFESAARFIAARFCLSGHPIIRLVSEHTAEIRFPIRHPPRPQQLCRHGGRILWDCAHKDGYVSYIASPGKNASPRLLL